jgi:23S rRNA (guanine745-N1)-methyltransferase
MLADVLPYLSCPHCGADLTLAGASVRCTNSHVFDVARQGYVNMARGSASLLSGDTAEMVSARADFLATGQFGPVVRAIVGAAWRAVVDRPPGCVVDLGAGSGHYLAPVLDALPGRAGLALDVSKYALRRAARAHPRIGAVGCDVWQRLPVRTGSAALALSVFAPRNPLETHRILNPNGTLIVVSPSSRHLAELIFRLGLLSVEPEKRERLEASLSPYFGLSSEDDWEFTMSLPHSDVESLVAMGPSAWHLDPAELQERVQELENPVPVTASVIVSTYRRRETPG